MTRPGMDPLTALLTSISQSGSQPWYPKAYAEQQGVPRESLDVPLERLRMLGLVELTEWVANHGQGYRLTPAGRKVLYNPRQMTQLATGTLPPAAPEPEPPPEAGWSGRGGRAGAYERNETIRAGLMSQGRPVVTLLLIGLNVAAFILGVALDASRGRSLVASVWGGSRIVLTWAAVVGPDIAAHQYWRLVTSFFIHIGVLHLAMNMYVLWVLGTISEKMWGRWRYLALYMISGFGGSCIVALTEGAAAGASGAIWGVMTGFLVWVFLNRSALPSSLATSWMRSVGFCLLLNLGLTFLPQILEQNNVNIGIKISVAGHLGGGAFGIVAALLLNAERFSAGVRRWAAAAAVVSLPVLAFAAVVVLPKGKLPVEAASLEELIEEGRQAFNAAGGAYKQTVAPVLAKAPDARTQEEVAGAQAALTEQQQKLSEAAAALERVGPSSNGEEEQMKKAMLDCLRERKEFFRLTARKLEKGKDWTNADQKALAEQGKLVDEATDRWGDLANAPKK